MLLQVSVNAGDDASSANLSWRENGKVHSVFLLCVMCCRCSSLTVWLLCLFFLPTPTTTTTTVKLSTILLTTSGPDHLAALLPRCCGQRWYRAGRVGALWGMGHGVSATILGVSAFFLKNTLGVGTKKWLAGASHVTEIAVGLSLILIGIMGIREAREWQEEIEYATAVQPQSLSAAAAPVNNHPMGQRDTQKRAVVLNGLLHGFSWDGAPSLAPAVAVATWSGNLAFLSAYAAGTMAAMAIATTLIGEGTRKAGQFMNRPDLPQKLSLVSSFVAIAIGSIWCGLALA